MVDFKILYALSELPGPEVVDADLLRPGEGQQGVTQLVPGLPQPPRLGVQVTKLLGQLGPQTLGRNNPLPQPVIFQSAHIHFNLLCCAVHIRAMLTLFLYLLDMFLSLFASGQ